METEPEASLDHVMAEESIILAGLQEAVRKGHITEDQKSDWLNEYIDKRNATANSKDEPATHRPLGVS